MPAIRNIFACLVHESPDCVIDLVRNLRTLDPGSLILLYNGSRDPNLLAGHFPFGRHGAVLHPSPRPAAWGNLHYFALDCMQWACDNYPFDTLTIVDSDQLAIRPGYSDYLGAHLKTMLGVGVLGNSSAIHVPGTRIGPAEAALREIELWRPFLRGFPDGEQKFVHWCFWPSTVFTADAARDLATLFASNRELQDIMRQTRIWASEEVILPTLAALLGYQIAINPCSYDYVQYRVSFAVGQIETAFDRREVFWVHPVPRRYDDSLRRHIRERWNHYEMAQPDSPTVAPSRQKAAFPQLLLTLPVLERMRGIEGWLDDAEADLLLAAASRAMATAQNGAVVEIGSYCGRSTVVLGAALNASGNPNGVKIYAIDPHDGIVGALDQGVQRVAPTRHRFLQNIANAGITHLVEPITQHSYDVEWDKPISFLFIDGLHDYFNVARDFYHFEAWIAPGAFIAFHDYADYYPGVKTFVDELLAYGDYEKIHQALSLIVVRAKREMPAAALPSDTVPAVAKGERSRDGVFETHMSAPSLISGAPPLVSCLMPTANRRVFVAQAIRYFQRQDYPNRELIILDDGSQKVADLIPSDSRIRYVEMDRRQSMGAKHNLACELARGEVIVHWDDDDWMADWRLSYQVDSLLAQPANTLCGLTRVYFYDPAGDHAWEYIYPGNDRPWVLGSTFCYRREFSQAHRFPDMNEGADTIFVWGLRDAEVLAHGRHDFYVGVVHPANTSPKRTHDPAWHPVPVQAISDLLAADYSFYEGLAGAEAAASR
jgi:predicted O-methyltransferase YrrM